MLTLVTGVSAAVAAEARSAVNSTATSCCARVNIAMWDFMQPSNHGKLWRVEGIAILQVKTSDWRRPAAATICKDRIITYPARREDPPWDGRMIGGCTMHRAES